MDNYEIALDKYRNADGCNETRGNGNCGVSDRGMNIKECEDYNSIYYKQ